MPVLDRCRASVMPVARRDPSGTSGRDRTLWDVITLTPPRAEDRFSSVLHFAHENAATLDVADLAAHAGYSPFHFTRIFSARMGIGPGQYLTALRIDAAKRMLLAGDDAVIDVASAVGFDSLSSFSRRFRSTGQGVDAGVVRRLADRISDRPPRPFVLPRPHPQAVRVHLSLPATAQARGTPRCGGLVPSAPSGLPLSGALVVGGPPLGSAAASGLRSSSASWCPCMRTRWTCWCPRSLWWRCTRHRSPRPCAGDARVRREWSSGTTAAAPALPSLCRRVLRRIGHTCAPRPL